MPFDFQNKKSENKAQWHFGSKNSKPEYDLNDAEIHTDVLGSYTGTGYDDIKPVQDADDL